MPRDQFVHKFSSKMGETRHETKKTVDMKQLRSQKTGVLRDVKMTILVAGDLSAGSGCVCFGCDGCTVVDSSVAAEMSHFTE